jgi:hypothetical protein
MVKKPVSLHRQAQNVRFYLKDCPFPDDIELLKKSSVLIDNELLIVARRLT